MTSPHQPTRGPDGTAGFAEFSLFVGALALGISEFASMGLLPQVADGTGVPVTTAGLAISAYALGVVVGAPLIALLFARAPRRGVLIGLSLLIAAGNGVTALAPDFISLVAARFVAGLPHGAYLGTAAMVAASLVPHDRRGGAVARVILGLSVANVVGVPLAAWVGQLVSWRIVFAGVGALALACAVLIRFTVPMIGPGPALGVRGELRAILRPRVLLALATAAIGFGGMFAIYSYLVPTLLEVTGVRGAAVPTLLAVFGVGMMVGNMAGGWLADRGVLRAVGILLVLSIASQFLFLFTAPSLPAVAVNIFLIGATSMGLGPALQTRLLDVAPDAQLLAASLNHSAFNLANALGAWLGGVVIAAGYGWNFTGVVGAILTLGGLAVYAASCAVEGSWTRRQAGADGRARSAPDREAAAGRAEPSRR